MSHAEGVNIKRRRVLIATTAAIGAVGVGAIATPFVRSWYPSAKAEAAGAAVVQDISGIENGQMITVKYRGKPIFVVKRTEEMVANLSKVTPKLSDPNSEASVQPEACKNETRSLQPELLVVEGVCTHLGCAPTYRPEIGAADLGGADWFGGFFCPCHGSLYDLAGRVYTGVPAPTNLPVPIYSIDGSILTVGEA
ncbi:ubiquinol-cytochrome c reductase iron-sulfur subunit [Moraxella catarrhalis]|uniref:Ubiquinol-cytochrome c reductase iron-sulfur subunit n=1 Tax=Moraxella catarrhalis TaxID=480 RepID=A0A198X962_MORCA|nr:ubiquinol-cytochrome c reductase iron-sulfur subunit [Moraxella catarrhalis]MPW64277.1 ubiquinol-cytochrome c reductase iron-sulfur subunit [Moraxella catarrhalis]MPX19484.1 ubiquinol-cytochrome c reductase iron-sulfur subunit [Moraxella catarrhalis]MPX29770.1 ubiquinol-cytochrome c reductase iron-sulfur subunit [Moraxella catarrhalis]MPY08048.1 ubiquinol-cytochrome c reductase iron-sulfur subunit [Moraxella catarrhalis]OAV05122.1 Ubiquinol-cytochrome C reductase iron-sulfur subunit [Moraxe